MREEVCLQRFHLAWTGRGVGAGSWTGLPRLLRSQEHPDRLARSRKMSPPTFFSCIHAKMHYKATKNFRRRVRGRVERG
jgi:hypothetical protein